MSGSGSRPSVLRLILRTLFGYRSGNAKILEQIKQLPVLPPRPLSGDRAAWVDYWQKMGQPWRTEPEIDTKRQEYLARRRDIVPNIEQGIYPYKDISLSRADVEWLLATHENGRGPVDWSDEHMWRRKRLDLRGADLRQIDLSNLPLTHMRGGLSKKDTMLATPEQCEMASVRLDGADLHWAHLERASLFRAHLAGANLSRARLEGTFLVGAHLERANLTGAHLVRSFLSEAYLEEAELFRAHLEGAFLNKTHFEKANLREAHLEGAGLRKAHLEGAILREAIFDTATNLENVSFSEAKVGFASLADVRWGGVNLAVVNWAQMKMLGDEHLARQKKTNNGEKKEKTRRLAEYQAAIRANRQLAVVLRDQGMHEEANRFAYHAQLLYRRVLWWQRKPLAFFFVWFLYLLAGYGYRPGRSIIAYLLVIGAFALVYLALGATTTGPHHLQWYEALVVSLTAFHGRGFFAEAFRPGDPQAFVAAAEAVVGLLIEISFIATFTQRFFGK